MSSDVQDDAEPEEQKQLSQPIENGVKGGFPSFD